MKQNKTEELIFRNEWKHSMGHMDYMTIRSRLAAIAEESLYAGLGGKYRVKSLSFVEPHQEERTDILSSIGRREAFRIRFYNENMDFIRLEKKTHVGAKTNKQSAVLTEGECRSILGGEFEWMSTSENSLILEFYGQLKSGKLTPVTAADFQREAFVYKPCNVRITMDSGLQTGIGVEDFLNLSCSEMGERKEAILMEVKYDCFLPELIRGAIRVKEKRPSSFSRYEARHAFGQA